ncbi:hypothetical protein BCR32DRAFT_271681, partial [Anaeromyces robustus]
MNSLKNIEKNKDNSNTKTSVFPTVEQIINDLQFQLSNINSTEKKILNSDDIIGNIKEVSNVNEKERGKYNDYTSIQSILKEKELVNNEKGKLQTEKNIE